ncbi:hypothetical protein [Sporosarcina luteola]|uniref:hypothetical protein n=1 Tax=Sporosarcina luteola TaxID=582850 RepID=UPI00203B0172|nr:hypothetical protein [Sporosarcina luteola]MCM3712011.1 hypothetical protein [Sporosarcina luteola]
MDKSPKDNSVTGKPVDIISSAAATHSVYENEIEGLKEAIILKDGIIQNQLCTIKQLTAERDELADRDETSGGWQNEIMDERKLLAILLERETVRIKKLVEVG